MILAAPLAAGGPLRLADVLEALSAATEAARGWGPAAGAALLVVSLAALTVAWRFRRPLAALGGAAVGALAALAAHSAIRVHLGLGPGAAAAIAAVASGLLCLRFPSLFPFAAGALPGAVVGSAVPLGGRAAWGAAAGAVVCGLAGLAAGRVVAAAFASAAGGVLLPVALVALFPGHGISREAAARPLALLALGVIAAVAGAAFQIGREAPAPPPPIAPRDLREPEEWRGE